jgi:Fic family protein
VLKAAAYFHLRFEYIHPFADGNGRVGRTLLNYFLMTHGHPPMVIYDEDKALYYACLQKYDEDEEIAPLVEFFKYETEKTWANQVEMSEGVSGERKSLLQLDDQSGEGNYTEEREKLLEGITIDDIAKRIRDREGK